MLNNAYGQKKHYFPYELRDIIIDQKRSSERIGHSKLVITLEWDKNRLCLSKSRNQFIVANLGKAKQLLEIQNQTLAQFNEDLLR